MLPGMASRLRQARKQAQHHQAATTFVTSCHVPSLLLCFHKAATAAMWTTTLQSTGLITMELRSHSSILATAVHQHEACTEQSASLWLTQIIDLWSSPSASWQVSSAAPVAAALASGTASEATLSYLYGGSAAEGVSELSMAIPVYEAIGRVCACTLITSLCGMLWHAVACSCVLQCSMFCAVASMSFLE